MFGVSISSLCGFFIIVTDQSIRRSIRSKAGIGLETKRALAEADATVIVPARTPDKARQHHERHRRTCVPLVAPGVPCSVLDDNVTALQGDGLVVVDFEPNLTFKNYGIVEGRRYMHPRFVALECLCQTRQTRGILLTRCFLVNRCNPFRRLGRKGDELNVGCARCRDDGKRIICLGLLVQLRNAAARPDHCVLKARYGLEAICVQQFVTLDN